MDKHHVLKKQICKRLNIDPDFYFNIVEIDHYIHINRIHSPKGNKKGDEACDKLYEYLIVRFEMFLNENRHQITSIEMNSVKTFYRYCTKERWNKVFFQANYEEIMLGAKILIYFSKNM